MRICLPDPALVLLVGAAGSGKSSLAARLFPAEAVLSSDALRGIVAGDETDQTVTRAAFSLLHREVSRRLAARRTTIVDATNVQAHARRALVRRASMAGVPAVAIVLDLPEALVLARNATRPGRRAVPAEVVRRQLVDLASSLRRGLAGEGFAAVHTLRLPADVDSLEVAWQP